MVPVESFVTQALDHLTVWMEWLVINQTWLLFLVVALLVFAEAAIFVGFLLPGETAAVLGGLATTHPSGPPLWLMCLVVVASAIVGDSVGYEVGKKFGPRLLRVRLLARHEHRLNNARQFLANRGGVAVFLGRYVAFLRAVMPALAGLSQMPYRRFLFWNAFGGLVWGVIFVCLGHFAKDQYDRLHSLIGPQLAAGVVAALGLLLLAAHIRREFRERRQG